MDPELKHYSVAFLHERGKIVIADAWLPAADLSDPDDRDRVLCAILGEHHAIDDPDDVRALYSYETAVLHESAAAPTASDNVVFRATMKRWEAYEGSDPWPQEPQYDLVVRHTEGALSVDIHPSGDDLDAGAPPRLGAAFEINYGVPCLHLYAGPAGEVARSFFGMPDDRLATRPGDSTQYIDHELVTFEIPKENQHAIAKSVCAMNAGIYEATFEGSAGHPAMDEPAADEPTPAQSSVAPSFPRERS